MTPAIAIAGAVVDFDGHRAVDEVSLDIPPQRTFGIVGESGSGKTTLMRAVLGLQRLAAGSIRLFGDIPAPGRTGMRQRSRLLQPIFQDPAASLSPRSRIGRLMAEVSEVLGESHAATMERLATILDRLGLPKTILEKYPHEISGGQARRAAIARALLMRPKLLIADEPTAGLDVSVQGDLLNLLQDLRLTGDITLVVISHNIAAVRLIADRIAVMRAGRLVESGPTSDVLDRPQEPYTRQLIASWPSASA